MVEDHLALCKVLGLIPSTANEKKRWGESVKRRNLRSHITTVTFSYLAVLFILPFRKRFMFYVYGCLVCMYGCAPHACNAFEDQKRASDPRN